MYSVFSTSRKISEGNTPLYKGILPEESFLKFEAVRLKNAKTVWLNFELLNELGIKFNSQSEIDKIKSELVNSFAYMIPNERDSDDDFDLGDKREFVAERYGDVGELCNGGGVRCGLNGNFQIKGVGRTLLAGKSMDFWHSHGGASIEEGVREAIWGEVFNKQLPNGAVRILAVIATGKTTPYDYGLLRKDGQKDPPGGLIIRQSNIRPSHYERAIYYKPLPELGADFVHDAVRTEKAMQMLGQALPGFDLNKADFKETVNAFKKVTTIYSEQVAYSKVLRLVHGSLTPGNIDISGRYIDFGTSTALSGFGNPITTRSFPPIWSEPDQIANNIRSFTFYLNKYWNPDCLLDITSIGNEILEYYYDSLSTNYTRAVLMICGFPIQLVKVDEDAKNLTNLILELARANTIEGIPLGTIPDTLGGCDIFKFLTILAKHAAYIDLDKCDKDVRSFDKIIDLVSLYSTVHNSTCDNASKAGIDIAAFKRLQVARISMFSKDLSKLYRDRLQHSLNEHINGTENNDELFDKLTIFVDEVLDDSIQIQKFITDFEACLSFKTLVSGLVYMLEVYDSRKDANAYRYVFSKHYKLFYGIDNYTPFKLECKEAISPVFDWDTHWSIDSVNLLNVDDVNAFKLT